MTNTTTILHDLVAKSLQESHANYEAMPCDPALADTAAFCEHYKFSQTETANCIIVASKSEPIQYACCLIQAGCKLDVNKKVSQLLKIKRLSFASADQTLTLTGMEIGGVTPFGLPLMPIFVDAAVMNNARIVLGGGNRSSKLLIDPKELAKLPQMQVVENLGLPR
jgi:prolyl-tRNA editing enzyme YbaK/EbsC (Cys-tRNA(Pro) deacylase)